MGPYMGAIRGDRETGSGVLTETGVGVPNGPFPGEILTVKGCLEPPPGPHKFGDVYTDGDVTFRWDSPTSYSRSIRLPNGYSRSEDFGEFGPCLRDAADAGGVSQDTVAKRFAADYDGRLRFCHDAGAWFVWNGATWRRDTTGTARRLLREVARGHASDESAREVGSARFVRGAEDFARGEQALAMTAEDWDADPMRLGTPGGTVELTTGALRPGAARDGITRATAVTPAETSNCPRWRRFIDEITGGDAALARFVQRFLGYTLTGETREQALLFGHGEGGNGKTVFINTVGAILGEYAMVAPAEMLAPRGTRGPTGDLAMLHGARLVVASETAAERGWDEARVKLITGGDRVTARLARRDVFTFAPSFKLIVVGNRLPALRTVDAAIRRRFCLLPFAEAPAKPDMKLEAKLMAEAPAILRWMIEGCLDWQTYGLGRPERVGEATSAYLAEQDLIGHFLAERCVTGDPSVGEAAASLFAAWTLYARAAGEAPGSHRTFAADMARRGLARQRTREARIYRGIRLRTLPPGSATET